MNVTRASIGRALVPSRLGPLLLGLSLAACATSARSNPDPGEEGGTGGEEPGGTGGAAGQGGAGVGGRGGAVAPGGSGGVSARDAATSSGGASGEDASAGESIDVGGSVALDAAGKEAAGAPPDAGTGPSSPLTAGFRQTPFTFSIHKPYDLPESARHSFDPATNTHTFWILKGDKPHDPPPNTTAPRTELRMQNNYTSGVHQFEADFYVVAGTDGPCIMQVFGGSAHATAFMLKAYGGNLKHYDRETVKTDAYEKWMHLNVIHTVATGEVKAYIDNQLVGTFKDNGPAEHYFKCGVYGSTSARSETRFRNIKYWVK
jgi:hypothetical protein